MTSRPTRSSYWTRTLLVLTIAAATQRCATGPLPSPRPPVAPPSTALTLRVEVTVDDARRIRTIPLEDYVRGSVPAEMPLAEPDTAVAERLARLQAILARTYALANRGRHAREGFDLCSTTHCQVYTPPDHQPTAVARLVATAVNRTRGLIITDDTARFRHCSMLTAAVTPARPPTSGADRPRDISPVLGTASV